MRSTAQKERATGEIGPATELELRTYALLWSSHDLDGSALSLLDTFIGQRF